MGLQDLYNEVFEDEMEKEAAVLAAIEEENTEEQEAEEMIKVAEDYVTAGRFMARGYHDEMEKLAGKVESAMKAGKYIAAKAGEAGKFAKDRAGKGWEATKKYNKGMAKDIKEGATGFTKGSKRSGSMIGLTKKERALAAVKGGAKASPYLGALGLAGYAASKKGKK